MFKPRWYQQEACDAFWQFVETNHDASRNPVLVLPTGTGKSVIIAYIIQHAVESWHGVKVLMLTHVGELVKQNAGKLSSIWPEADIGICSATLGHKDTDNSIIFGNVQSVAPLLKRDPNVFGQRNLIIIDECHMLSEDDNSQYRQVIAALKKLRPQMRVLGLSATPYRMKGGYLTEQKNAVFTDIVYDLNSQFERLIEEGYLSPVTTEWTKPHVDLSRVGTRAGDYKLDELQKACGDEAMLQNALVEVVKRSAGRRAWIVFIAGIENCNKCAQMLRDMSINAYAVNSSFTADENAEKIEGFRKGEIRCLVSADQLTTGFDVPQIDLIAMLRPTKSPGLYCLDEQTEILTKKGWVKDADIGDMVAAFDKDTGHIVYTPILAKVRRPLEKDECFYSINSFALDIRVTNKHRMLFDSKKKKGWRIATAEYIANLKDGCYIPVSGESETKGLPLSDDEIRFLTWVMTDGSINKTNRAIYITQGEHQPWIQEIEDCIKACGMKYGKRSVWRNTQFKQTSRNVIFSISHGSPRGTDTDKKGWSYLEKYADRDIPDSFFEMNTHQFEIMLRTAHLADGHKNIYSIIPGNSYHISKGNKRFIERLQILAVTHGYKANVSVSYQNKNPLYTLHVKKKTFAVCGSSYDGRPTWKKEEHTAENCWCVQNSYGTLVTRRNGKVAIVGNCQMVGRGLRPAEGKKDCLVLDFARNIERLGPINAPFIRARNDAAKKSSDKKQQAPVKVCPGCNKYIPVQATECPHCGQKLERNLELELKAGVLIERTFGHQAKAGRKIATVISVDYTKYKSASGNVSFCAVYTCIVAGKKRTLKKWFTFNQKSTSIGYKEAVKAWRELNSNPYRVVPASVDEAYQRANELKKPLGLEFIPRNFYFGSKFDEITEFLFNESTATTTARSA